jgi:hypothetical protein
MGDLLELTARAEATHFWFHGFRGYVAPDAASTVRPHVRV